MDPRILPYYERELQYMREMGGEFAREFPKIAGRLGMDGFEVADPYVERLLEGFAFLTARLHLRLEGQFPQFTQHLLEVLYPHFLAPTPSMAVVQLQPDTKEGILDEGYLVPRGTMMRSEAFREDGAVCRYQTGQNVTLWPLELVRAEYGGHVADLGSHLGRMGRPVRAGLRLRLRTPPGMKVSQLSINALPLFLRSGGDLGMRLYEQLTAHTVGLVVRQPAGGAQHTGGTLVLTKPLRALGLDDEHALLPFDHRSFQGYRLLQEYFAFPQRYLFVELNGLREGVRACQGNEFEIVVALDAYDPSLEGAVDASNFVLHCTPVINVFPRQADRIHLNDRSNDHHVLPDRTRPMDFEVWSITDVRGYGNANEQERRFRPLYARPDLDTGTEDTAAYYTVNRRPRMLSATQKAKGPRSSYVGTEVFVGLVDGAEGPFRSDVKQLAVDTLCTNRDLPLQMSLGGGDTDFVLDGAAPVAAVRVLSGPTAPAVSHAQGQTSWRLISQLGLDYLSLVDGPGTEGAASIRELLKLYADLTNSPTRRQIDGVRSVSSRAITRRIPVPGPTAFGRGLELTLTMDESAFEGSGAYLLTTVLQRFFTKYASINSFTETVLKTLQRGEVRRWPPSIGQQHVL